MMEWVQLTQAVAEGAMPTASVSANSLEAAYDAWLLADPAKAGRLSEIRLNILARVRDAILTNRANTVPDDRETIPRSCVQASLDLIWHALAMEMGIDISSSGSQAMIRADLFIRQIAYGHFVVENQDGGAPSPSFVNPAASQGRRLPTLIAFCLLLCLPVARAGWIDQGSTIYDTSINMTYSPNSYTPFSTLLAGHMYGIDSRLSSITSSITALQASGIGTNFFDLRTDNLYKNTLTFTGYNGRISMTTYDVTGPFSLTLGQGGTGQGYYLSGNPHFEINGVYFHQPSGGNPHNGYVQIGELSYQKTLDVWGNITHSYGTAPWPTQAAIESGSTSFVRFASTITPPLTFGSNDLAAITMPPSGIAHPTVGAAYLARPIEFLSSWSGNLYTSRFSAGWSSGQTAPYFWNGSTWVQMPTMTTLGGYQTLAGFNDWATFRLQWVGAAPTTRSDTGTKGQIRGDVGGTNIYIHNGQVWGLAFTINTNALPP